VSAIEAPRSFAVLLHEIGDGSLLAALSAELHDVVSKCQDFALNEGATGRGELVLKLTIKAEKNGTAALTTAITSKAPRAKLPPQGLWISKGGNLLTENPRQVRLKFVEMNKPAVEAREAPPPSAAERVLPPLTTDPQKAAES
jgi:hypothetical protein